MYLDLVEIGGVNESFDFSYVEGENIDTVWQGKKGMHDCVASIVSTFTLFL